MRPVIWFRERQRRKALKGAFDAVKAQAISLEGSHFPANKVFMNVALFFLLAERDISAVKLDALTHPDPWTRSVALRTILLTICEWDMDKVAGKKLRQAMEDAVIPDAVKTEVFGSLRDMRKAQQRADKIMSPIRNTAVAHRDPNALLQSETIETLDSKLILELTGAFYDASHRFMDVFPRLLAAGSSLRGLLKQYSSTDPPNSD